MEKQDYDYDAVIRDIVFNGFDVVDNRENHQQQDETKELNEKIKLQKQYLELLKRSPTSSK